MNGDGEKREERKKHGDKKAPNNVTRKSLT